MPVPDATVRWIKRKLSLNIHRLFAFQNAAVVDSGIEEVFLKVMVTLFIGRIVFADVFIEKQFQGRIPVSAFNYPVF